MGIQYRRFINGNSILGDLSVHIWFFPEIKINVEQTFTSTG